MLRWPYSNVKCTGSPVRKSQIELQQRQVAVETLEPPRVLEGHTVRMSEWQRLTKRKNRGKMENEKKVEN